MMSALGQTYSQIDTSHWGKSWLLQVREAALAKSMEKNAVNTVQRVLADMNFMEER